MLKSEEKKIRGKSVGESEGNNKEKFEGDSKKSASFKETWKFVWKKCE